MLAKAIFVCANADEGKAKNIANTNIENHLRMEVPPNMKIFIYLTMRGNLRIYPGA